MFGNLLLTNFVFSSQMVFHFLDEAILLFLKTASEGYEGDLLF